MQCTCMRKISRELGLCQFFSLISATQHPFLKKNTIIYLVAPDFSYNSIDRQKLVLKHSVLCFLPNSKYCVLSGETERRILSCQSREIKYYSIIKSQSQTLEARTYLYIHIIFVVFTRFNTYQVVKHPS